jgi:hypothetical protein
MPTRSVTPNGSPLVPIERTREIVERRGRIRYVADLKGQVQPITSMETGNRWPVYTFDISAGGVSLVVSRRFEAGTLLGVSLGAEEVDSSYMPLARVQHVMTTGEHWILGCSWIQSLEEADMQTLLGPPREWKTLSAA